MKRSPLAWALGLFAVWTATTWLLEGRIETLLRPEATKDRVVYALVANLLIGVGASLALLRFCLHRGADARYAGFGAPRRTAVSVMLAMALGLALYVAQGAPPFEPVVLGNAFAQVFVVSAAEVLVCWSLLGWSAELAARPLGPVIAVGLAALLASVLFGAYHFAHSAPFNSLAMVALLSAVGLATSVFFFASRDVAGTIVFHNFLGTFGVVQALDKDGALATFETWQPPLLLMAFITAAVLGLGYQLRPPVAASQA